MKAFQKLYVTKVKDLFLSVGRGLKSIFVDILFDQLEIQLQLQLFAL